MKPFKLACIQLGDPTSNKYENLNRALNLIQEAATNGAQLVCLPEYACLRETKKEAIQADAEDFGCSPTTDFSTYDVQQSSSILLQRLSKAAQTAKVWLFAGSYPEKAGDKVYNTMPVVRSSF